MANNVSSAKSVGVKFDACRSFSKQRALAQNEHRGLPELPHRWLIYITQQQYTVVCRANSKKEACRVIL